MASTDLSHDHADRDMHASDARFSAHHCRITEALRTTVRHLDPSLAVAHIRSLARIVEEQFSTPRFALFLIGLFAGLALLLASIGIYGVIAHSVSQRMHEFGMRVALGASSWNLITMVMKQGVLLSVIGVAIGLGCSLAFADVLDSLLYEVSARDPLTLVGVGAMAIGTATLASLPSARRATGAGSNGILASRVSGAR